MTPPGEPLAPASLPDLVAAVRATRHLVPAGAGTKSRTDAVPAPFQRLSLLALRGIVEYEPDEYTITALAGTPLREVAGVLAERRQYLPFDPMFLEAGCTVGGTVAAGTSGPGRLRYGGVRDFILGVRLVDGAGQLLRMGGKVVKNAAGFDLPKFLVGSLGRLGVLGEVTFKVFPRPAAALTVRIPAPSLETAVEILGAVSAGRWAPEALDLPPGSETVYVRLAGPEPALAPLARDLLTRWSGECLPDADASAFWTSLREAEWSYAAGTLARVALTSQELPGLARKVRSIPQALVHFSAAGNLAWISTPPGTEPKALDDAVRGVGLRGLVLRGAGPLWLGAPAATQIAQAVKQVLDPDHRFPSLD